MALQDGVWHHADSYAPERAARPDTVALWRAITTAEDPEWTRRYHSLDPAEQAFGGRAEFELADGRPCRPRSPSPTRIRSARGRSPARTTSASSAPSPTGVLAPQEIERFLDVAERLPSLTSDELAGLTITRRTCRRPRRDCSDAVLHRDPVRGSASGSARGSRAAAIQRFPGAFTPAVRRLVQEKGFEGVYLSGAVMANELGLPDIGLTTLTEVATRAAQIASATDLPVLVDADTGFGEPMNAARTVQALEDAGVAGLHIEDQVNPKRCGHLDGKDVVDTTTAVRASARRCRRGATRIS